MDQDDNWPKLKKQLQAVVYDCTHRLRSSSVVRNKSKNNVVLINLTLVMDTKGNPIGWSSPKSLRMEPGNYDWLELFSFFE